MNIVKQYGLERSGTNYIKALIERNLENTYVLASAWGAKHNRYYREDYYSYDPTNDSGVLIDPNIMNQDFINEVNSKFIKNEIFFIVSIKEPHEWVISYRRYLKRHGLNYDIHISKLIEKWNTFNRNWIASFKYNNYNYFVVKYNELRNDPMQVIEKISLKSGFMMKGNFSNITNDMGEGADVPGELNILNHPYDNKKPIDGLISNEESEYIEHFYDRSLV